MSGLALGQLISLPDGRQAVIRFIGTTQFAPGDWIGIELDEPTGKNDGSVQGERYFECEPGYGMFIRPSAVAAVLEQRRREDHRLPATTRSTGPDSRSRPPSAALGGVPGTRRPSVLSTSSVKRQSSNASSPSPAAKAPAVGRSLRSPTKSPVKQLTTSASRTSLSDTRTQTPTSRARQSVPTRSSVRPAPPRPPSTKPTRQSLVSSVSRTSKPTSQQARPTSGGPPTTRRLALKSSATRVSAKKPAASDSTELNVEDGQQEASEAASGSESNSRLSSSQFHRSSSGNAALNKELEDLKTKLRLVEKKRTEDREKLKALEALRAERDKFEGIIQKLQAKYQPQQQEITQLRKHLKELEEKLEEAERIQAEHDSILEMAALDREMAEEMAEAAKMECEALKAKNEELQLEVEVLREENEELGQVMSPEEKSSQGWLQMERTNERLREALIRLRDITQQQEADLKSQIRELEEELEDYSALKSQYEHTKEQLMTTEANLEELKQQVEALGAEEMIEELTEKNMQYQEEIQQLKAVIEDLESLKELNDELEINHIETEKQLQEEIDYRDSICHEQSRKLAQQDEIIEDLEYTLSKFRELVTNLQSDLEDMRVSQQLTESEANELTAKSRAMIDLNLKLQASVAKAHVKSIDMELGRMEAEESAQHLSIMKLYLPEYFETERNPILTLLRFKRVGFKASLISNTIWEKMSEPSLVTSGQDIFLAHEILEKLTWTSLLCDRFANFISGCSSEEFSNFEGALYELDPVERNLNLWIEDLKKDELKEKRCAEELQRSIAVLSHLAETLIPSEAPDAYANEIYMRSVMTQTYLEHTGSCLTQLKNVLQNSLPFAKDEVEEWPYFTQKIDTLASQARGGKVVVGKITRSLEELMSRNLCLANDCVTPFEKTENAAKELSELARQLGDSILKLTSEEGRTEPITYAEILAKMSQTTTSLVQFSDPDTDGKDALACVGNKLRALVAHLEELASVSSDLSQTIEFERRPSPWIERAKELKARQVIPPDADEEIRRLRSELSEVSTALGVKDKMLEEQTIKIELLESRTRDTNKKAALLKELEATVESIRQRENELLNVVERQSKDLQQVQTERDEYRSRLEKVKRASGSTGVSGSDGVVPNAAASLAVMRENELLQKDVANLQAAVRFLRDENRRARLLDPYSVQRTNNIRSWLDVPLMRPKPSVHEQPDRRAVAECQDVLSHLLKLAKESNFVNLKSTRPVEGEKRLAWRSVKSTTRYHILKQRDEYEQWSQWKDEVARRERTRERKEASKATQHAKYSLRYSLDKPSVLKGQGTTDDGLESLDIQNDDYIVDTLPCNTPKRVRIVNP
ncbi:hypothetical protein VTO42DRAFT_1886 [Malbranchea cinnamomea]